MAATTMYARGSVNVRSGPSTGNAVIAGLSQGQQVRVTGRAGKGGSWAQEEQRWRRSKLPAA